MTEMSAHKGGRFLGSLQIADLAEDPISFCQRLDHHAIPGGHNLIIDARSHALAAHLQQFLTRHFQLFFEVFGVQAQLGGHLIEGASHVEDVLAFPVALTIHAVVGAEIPSRALA